MISAIIYNVYIYTMHDHYLGFTINIPQLYGWQAESLRIFYS